MRSNFHILLKACDESVIRLLLLVNRSQKFVVFAYKRSITYRKRGVIAPSLYSTIGLIISKFDLFLTYLYST